MKTIRIISQTLCLVGLLFLTSCDDKDENSIKPSEKMLEGTWAYETAEIEITINGQSIVDYLMEVFELSEEDANLVASMLEEDSFEFNNASWKFKGDKTFTAVDDDETTSGTWSLSADQKKLTLTADDETDIVDVLVLTSSKLHIAMSLEEEVDLDEDGTNETLAISAKLKLKK